VAGCKGCRKKALSERIIGSEELLAQLIPLDKLPSWLTFWAEFQVKLI
jgi:hypothetical protein